MTYEENRFVPTPCLNTHPHLALWRPIILHLFLSDIEAELFHFIEAELVSWLSYFYFENPYNKKNIL